MSIAVRAAFTIVAALAIIGTTMPTIVAAADVVPVDPTVPVAQRLDPPEPEPEPVAPPGSRCPELYPIVVEHWPNAALHWPLLDKILWRESRCNPYVVNRYGCVGLMQVCRINHRRLGVTRADLLDPATNIATGYRLCLESQRHRRSCWSPWWVGRWRP